MGKLETRGVPKHVVLENILARNWSSLFGIKPVGKFYFPPVKNISSFEQGMITLEIPDQIIDRNISRMDLTLVGRFLGTRPNIEVVRAFFRRKWALKG